MRKFLFNRSPTRIGLEEYRATLTRSEVARPENNFYHWLLGTSWTRFLLLVIAVYLGTNLLFAFAYLACGDGAITHAQPGSLLDAFFFSVQTMATIGYGRMTPVGSWPNAIVTFEAFFGIVYSALTTGLAFARFTRPTAGVRFSKVAVVGSHDGVRTFKFRVANDRSSHIVEAQLRPVIEVKYHSIVLLDRRAAIHHLNPAPVRTVVVNGILQHRQWLAGVVRQQRPTLQ